jgi:hypothetical protein
MKKHFLAQRTSYVKDQGGFRFKIRAVPLLAETFSDPALFVTTLFFAWFVRGLTAEVSVKGVSGFGPKNRNTVRPPDHLTEPLTHRHSDVPPRHVG